MTAGGLAGQATHVLEKERTKATARHLEVLQRLAKQEGMGERFTMLTRFVYTVLHGIQRPEGREGEAFVCSRVRAVLEVDRGRS